MPVETIPIPYVDSIDQQTSEAHHPHKGQACNSERRLGDSQTTPSLNQMFWSMENNFFQDSLQ